MKKLNTTFRLLTALTVASVALSGLSGCSTSKGWFGKRDNGSLDYQKSQLLAPIQIPVEKQTQPFRPLYPTVEVRESSISTTNESGKQYRLPAPTHTVN